MAKGLCKIPMIPSALSPALSWLFLSGASSLHRTMSTTVANPIVSVTPVLRSPQNPVFWPRDLLMPPDSSESLAGCGMRPGFHLS
ncbi:hypothetical protein C8J56DRAFT_948743 [Mycena floridula]|nr:hypothetical protein C8J56DRAFT_948743 [Mycena floridula]